MFELPAAPSMMADPTASPKPNHHPLLTDDVETTTSTRHDDATPANVKSGNIVTSDNGVTSNPNEPLTDVTEPSPKTGETAHVEPAAGQQYEDLVSKIQTLESMLARVDNVVRKELVEPLNDVDLSFDDMSDDDPDHFRMEKELIDYLRQQNTYMRESSYIFRSTRRIRRRRREAQNRMRSSNEKKVPDNEATVNAEVELKATIAARRAEVLANNIPATSLRTTWAQFQSASSRSHLAWQMERRNESIINPFELLVGEPESTLIGTRERRPAPRSGPVNPADVRAPGEAPLPERILFHSPELIGILIDIHENGDFGDDEDLLGILRPLKMLVYFERQLRDYATSLQAKEVDAVREDGSTATLKDDVEDDSRTSDKESENNSSDDWSIEQDNSVRLMHIRCLLDFIDNEVNTRKENLRSGRCEKLTFSDLWYLFQPGFEVIDQDNKQAYRVVRVVMPKHNTMSPWERFRRFNDDDEENLEKPARIHCIYIDFDGEKIGPVSRTFEIPRFDQEKLIEALPIYPLWMVPEADFRDRLAERGQMLWDVIQVKPMYYTGHTIDTREEADSQVMIDFSEAMIHAYENEKEWKPRVDFIPTSFEEPDTSREKKRCRASCCYGQFIHDDSYVEVKQTEEFIKSQLERSTGERSSLMIYPQTIGEILEADSTPNRDELVLMSYRAFGFILRSRKWGE